MSARHARSVLPALAACVVVSGCADGGSERSDRDERGDTSVENAFIVPAFDTACVLQINAPAQLSFTATNNSSTTTEQLQTISTPAASAVSITAPVAGLTLAPHTSIAAGQPVQNTSGSAAPDQPFAVSLRGLRETVQPGKSVPVTFEFTRAGSISIDVAVDACPTQIHPGTS